MEGLSVRRKPNGSIDSWKEPTSCGIWQACRFKPSLMVPDWSAGASATGPALEVAARAISLIQQLVIDIPNTKFIASPQLWFSNCLSSNFPGVALDIAIVERLPERHICAAVYSTNFSVYPLNISSCPAPHSSHRRRSPQLRLVS